MNMSLETIRRYAILAGLGVSVYLLIQAWNADYGRAARMDEEADRFADNERLDGTQSHSDITEPEDLALPPAAGVDRSSDYEDPLDTAPDRSLLQQTDRTTRGDTAFDESTIVKVSTPLMNVQLDRRGGDVVYVDLPKHPISIDHPETPVVLLTRAGGRSYYAQSGLIGRDWTENQRRGLTYPLYSTRRDDWTLSENDDELEVVFTTEYEDVELRKIFLFSSNTNLIRVRYELSNFRRDPVHANLYAHILHDNVRPESAGTFFAPRPYLGAALTTDDDAYVKWDFEDVSEQRVTAEVQGGWVAILQHYFLSSWVTPDESRYRYYGDRANEGLYRFGMTGPEQTIAPGRTGEFSIQFYAGPKTQSVLKEIDETLYLTVDYGWFWWLAVPLFWILELCHDLTGNWGVAIILMTLFIKIVLFPLAAMSYMSMARMRQLSPQMKRIQERYGSDRQKLAQEMTAFYRREKVNPLGGCLPLLLQFPVFIALYWVLFESVELRQAPFMLWIQDLSIMDPYYVLPILMGASMFLMQSLNPPIADPMQQKMMKFMPLIFTVLLAFFPAGLTLYWLVQNLLSFGQQYIVTKYVERRDARPPPSKPPSPSA